MHETNPCSFTAFPGTESVLRERIIKIDVDAFRIKKRRRCSFQECSGMCCSLPVAVTDEETEVLVRIVKEEAQFFNDIGIKLPNKITKVNRSKTRRFLAQKRRSFSAANKVISYFLSADRSWLTLKLRDCLALHQACLFLVADGRCALQLFSVERGLHKWHYKPINCWKYPINIKAGSLTIAGTGTGRVFPCNAETHDALPAYQTLEEELLLLSKIINRPLLDEIIVD